MNNVPASENGLMVSDFRPALKVPILETPRLILRGHCPEDFESCAVMWADPMVTRYIGGRPFTREESWARLLRYVGHWSLLGFGYWVVEEKATGAFVGEVGFADHKREMEPSLEGMPETGWVLTCESQGKGYATEAVRAVVEWGDAQFARRQTACIIHPENRASIRVAEKCGYQGGRQGIYKGQPTLVLVR